MKKITLIITLIAISSTIVSACDFCNCYLGLSPQSKKNDIGLRYHYKNYSGTHIEKSEMNRLGLTNDDFLETRTNVELHGQFQPTQKFQILFSFPYIINNEEMSAKAVHAMEEASTSTHSHTHSPASETETIHNHIVNKGIGDPLLVANYRVFNQTVSDSNNFSHCMFVGAGIRLPIGKYKIGEGADPLERVHLPGTGSSDLMANASYIGKINKTGCNINLSYMLTGKNNQSFEFGDRINANATFYYQVDLPKCGGATFFPNTGIYYERAAKDKNSKLEIRNSGGMIMLVHAGFDVYYKRISLNTALQLPVIQTLNQPQPELHYRFITGISYSFN